MNRSIFIFLLALFAIVHFSVADANWRDDAAELKKIRHDNFELRAYPAPQANAFNFAFGDLQPNGESVFFLYQKNVLSFSISDGTKQDINDVVINDKTPLIIRRHGVWLEVLTPAKRLCRVPTFAKLKGQFLVAKADGKPAIEKLDYQRLEPFAFGDDFMRTEEEAKQWGVWTPVSGEWKIYSVMERIHDNPAARIR
ncbi:MAG: hypothetical protein J6Y35_02435, partial [Bacteroidales bacterium]|nr:hypothetical protein [Bacteroidales bacterium]